MGPNNNVFVPFWAFLAPRLALTRGGGHGHSGDGGVSDGGCGKSGASGGNCGYGGCGDVCGWCEPGGGVGAVMVEVVVPYPLKNEQPASL